MSSQPGTKLPSVETQGRVLIVDDEVELTNALVEMLAKQGYETTGFTNGNQALEALKSQKFDVLLADLMMPEINGLALLKAALEIDPGLICILMTGQGTVQTAVDAMKGGAFDYILKPFKLNTMLASLHRSMDIRRLRTENVQLRELVSIYELGRSIAAQLDVEAILQQTCQAALQVCEADEASIMLPIEGEDELVIATTCNDRPEELIGQIVPVTGSVSGWVVQNQEILVSEGRVDSSLFPASYPRESIHTALSLPMMLGDKLMGIINVNHTQSAAAFTPGQKKGLEILTHIAASAIQNARLFEQKEKQLHRVAALRTIDLAISSSLDLRVTLNIVMDQVTSQLGVETAAILLANPQSQILEFAAGRGFRNSQAGRMQTFIGPGYAGTAALERRTIAVPDLDGAGSDPLIEMLRSTETIRSIFATPLITKGDVKGVLMVFRPSPFSPDEDWLNFFEVLAGQAAIAIDSTRLFDNLQRTNQQLILAYNTTIEGWSRALDLRDRETEGHTQRVTEMTLRLARAMGVFDDEDLVNIRRGSLLHDIGKMGIPDEILHKPGELNAEEEAVMRKHPEYAYQLLYPIAYLRKALDIPYLHHERWDGTGYPLGLKGEQIPLAARVFAVVDVWDALRSDRPYRTGWSHEQVIEYIQNESGKHFDPQVVEKFLQLFEEEARPKRI